jgi:hypothetical protein
LNHRTPCRTLCGYRICSPFNAGLSQMVLSHCFWNNKYPQRNRMGTFYYLVITCSLSSGANLQMPCTAMADDFP